MILAKLSEHFRAAIQALPQLKDKEVEISFVVPKEREHGDFATNLAFLLAKKNQLNPVELAKKLVEVIQETDAGAYLARIEVAGPGFINLFLNQQAWQEALTEILAAGKDYGRSPDGKDHTIVIDYGGENIAKPMSVGHLRSNILGQATANIYRYLGWRVIGDNFVGDWGTQFGKLITAYKHWGDQTKIEEDPITELVTLYQRFHQEAEKQPELEDEARAEFSKLEQGDEENRHLWEWFVKESFTAFDVMHNRLGVLFDVVRGESFYEPMLAKIIKEFRKHKFTIKNKDGSMIIDLTDEGLPPMLIQKSDGSTLYATRDLAAIKSRLAEFKPERLVYFVDQGQELHFRQLFAAARKIDWNCDYTHAAFGRVNFGGKRMATRAGHVIQLAELLDKTVAEASKLLTEKGLDLGAAKKEKVAEMVGVGAVIYNDLSQNRITDIDFSWEKALDFDGNTAPYLQYSYARAKSILAKAEEAGKKLDDLKLALAEPLLADESALIQHALTYQAVLEQAALEYKPNLVANFAYELAQRFNHFYNSLPVLKAKQKQQQLRLGLTLLVVNLLKSSLALLGIKVPAQM